MGTISLHQTNERHDEVTFQIFLGVVGAKTRHGESCSLMQHDLLIPS